MVHLVFLHFRENVISTKCCVFANKGNNVQFNNKFFYIITNQTPILNGS